MSEPKRVFVTGGTGYVGSRLIPMLCERGHDVHALVRKGSEGRVPTSCTSIIGDALDGNSFSDAVRGAHTFVQLVGVSHPSPAKAKQFEEIDLRSGCESIRVATQQGVGHFIYVSVAQPAPAMRAYINVRAQCEQRLRESGLNATILRPWYVLGPGHRWPMALVPVYAIARHIPATRDGATRLGLVTIQDMLRSLLWAVENPVAGVRILGAPEIKAGNSQTYGNNCAR